MRRLTVRWEPVKVHWQEKVDVVVRFVAGRFDHGMLGPTSLRNGSRNNIMVQNVARHRSSEAVNSSPNACLSDRVKLDAAIELLELAFTAHYVSTGPPSGNRLHEVSETTQAGPGLLSIYRLQDLLRNKPFEKRYPLLRYVTEASIAIVAIGYTLGFLSWSVYALYQGLGFLRLTAQQYLVAGELLAFFLLVLLTPDQFLSRWVWRVFEKKPATWENRSLRVLAEVVVKGLAGYFGLGALFLVARVLPIVDSRAVFSLPTMVGFIVGPPLLFLVGLMALLPSSTVKQKANGARDRLGRRGGLASFMSGTVFVALALLIFPSTLLPAMPQAFGGAEPRMAHLDLDASKLSPEMAERLLDNVTRDTLLNRTTVRSVKVSILFDGPDSLLLRRADEADANAPLFELSTSVVLAKVWLS